MADRSRDVTGAQPRIAVVGGGLIGSAAARHLADAGVPPTVFAPDEPVDKRAHHGVFGSHYDEGRITRQNDHDPFWAEAAIAAIGRYSEIEAQSGISFYTERGALFAAPAQTDYLQQCRAVAERFGIKNIDLDEAALHNRFPYLNFPDGTDALFEPTKGGFISPRRLVEAQRTAASRKGAKLINEAVTAVEDRGKVATVHFGGGALEFDQIIVAAGFMTDHVLGRAPSLSVLGRTIALIEISEGDAASLNDMPPILLDTPFADYILPPIRYPDKRILLKIGGEPRDHPLVSSSEIGDWFRQGGDPGDRDAMADALRAMMPGLKINGIFMDACATSYTPDEKPEIRHASDRIVVAAGGCGGAAKSSDEFGRRAAALVTAERQERIDV